jgi:hypothetical protein
VFKKSPRFLGTLSMGPLEGGVLGIAGRRLSRLHFDFYVSMAVFF